MPVIDEQDTTTKQRVIRFNVAGRWTVQEMGEFFIDLDDLAELSLNLHLRIIRQRERPHEEIPYIEDFINQHKVVVLGGQLLEIKRIHFSSPGIQDIAGAGVVIGHIKDFIFKIIEITLDRKLRTLMVKKLEMENVKAFLQLADQHGLSNEELEFLIEQVNRKQQRIKHLVVNRKLLSVQDQTRHYE